MRFASVRVSTWLLLSGLFATSAALIWVRTETVRATYLYVKQEKEVKALGEDLQELRVDWLKKTSPGKLQNLAAKLDLHTPNWNQTVRLK